jgi:uncharacterized protein YrrD
MFKLQSILGLPVLERESGMQIGEVVEAILQIERASVAGVVVATPNCSDNLGLVFNDLVSIGRDAIMVHDGVRLQQVNELPLAANVCYLHDLCDKQVFTETGLLLGTLVDLTCDCDTGEIKYYEISDGIITDLLYGRRLMPLPQAQVVNEQRLIVPESMAKLIISETD